MTGTMNPNETNFRILAGFVEELVRGTKCDSVTHSHEPITFPNQNYNSANILDYILNRDRSIMHGHPYNVTGYFKSDF